MRRTFVLGSIIGAGIASIAVTAYQSPAQGPSPQAIEATRIEKVRDNLYMITGSTPMPRETFSGGNTGVFVTEHGVIVVDTKLGRLGSGHPRQIKTVTDKPVTTIINTHTHGDHTGSNRVLRRRSTSSRTRTPRRTWRRWTHSRGTRRSSCRSGPTRTS